MARIETIGDRIAKIRRDKDIPQYKLASDIGIHPSSLNQIEKGRRRPKADTVSALAKALDTTRDYLEDGIAGPTTPRIGAPQNVTAVRQEDHQLSALIRSAVHETLRDFIVDIVGAVTVAVATAAPPAQPDRETSRSKIDERRTGRS